MDARLKVGFSPTLMRDFIFGESNIYRVNNICVVRVMLKDGPVDVSQFQTLNLN